MSKDILKDYEWNEVLWKPLIQEKESLIESERNTIRVAAYARTSKKISTQLQSLENQIDYFTRFIQTKPQFRLVSIYYDEGVSGTKMKNRFGLKRLLRHCREGKIDYIVTKSISRFSRNVKELIEVVKELQELKVGLYFQKENLDTSKEFNEFLLATYAALAQNEVETLSHNVSWGYEKRALRGSPKFERILGYHVTYQQKKTHISVDEEEAGVVKKIYELFLDGAALNEIARYLMQEGIQTSKGGTIWDGSVVKKILTNVAYTGNRFAYFHTTSILDNGKPNDVPSYYIENSHPAIIDPSMFEEVQKRFKPTERKEKNKKADFRSLSGRVMCGICGCNYQFLTDYATPCWRCRMSKSGMCDSTKMYESEILSMIKKAFEERFSSDSIALRDIFYPMKRLHEHDYLEHRRLLYFSDIRLVKEEEKVAPEKELDGIVNKKHQLEEEFFHFERYVKKIEEDRPYREKALSWMKSLQSLDEFFEKATIDYFRAWVVNMTIYSKDTFIVHWFDQEETKVGEGPMPEPPRTLRNQKRKEKSTQTGIDLEGKEDGDVLVAPIKREANSTSHVSLTKQIKKEQKNMWKVEQSLQTQTKQQTLRTASYCRVSTEQDAQQISLESQVAYYTYLILKNPEMSFAGIFADRGLSGTQTKNRTEFNRLMQKCKQGKVDQILTKSISRFTRNTVDALYYVRMLKSLNPPVYVHFERENIHTADKDSDLMLTVLSSMAQEEAINVGTSSQWGKQKLAEIGIVRPSRFPYGYIADERKNWCIEPKQAAVVKRMYESYAAGKSIGRIARELSEDGIETANGNRYWHPNTVGKILASPVYKGCILYQQTYVKDPFTRKQVVNQGELPQYYIEDHHPAIITPEDWEKVQTIRKSNQPQTTRSSVNAPHPFRQVFRCGECGGVMGLHTYYTDQKNSNKRKARHYWRCRAAAGKNFSATCLAPSFREEYLEHNFMSALMVMKSEDLLEQKIRAVIEKTNLTTEELAEVKEIEATMEQLNQELYEAVDEELNQAGQDTKRVEALTNEIVKLKNQLDAYEERQELAAKYQAEFEWLVNELHEIDDFNPLKQRIPFRADLFERIVESGVIHSDGRIVYQLKLGVEWEAYLEEKCSYKLKVKRKRKKKK
ncbi:hypothetical protein E1I69_05625 [Bacillus timonensis]|uniref:Recombinase family protein n=1 Tax=Bacillus timonensis TaxID=1033734 RepID=A0A4S3PVW5_9BACI|nr:recombinase family protein [Bacillus timonensis]THE13981.1 hypothetical protein E1I69_05625 [Bacillus timonensis]